MSGLLTKAALLIALTHGLRWLGRLVGPRRGGLLLGLPCSTALMLVSSAQERGVGDAARMAEASLLGLVGAVALPLAYAWVVGFGSPLVLAAAMAIFTYGFLAWSLSLLPDPGAIGGLGIAVVAVLAACRIASKIPPAARENGTLAPSRLRCAVLRTLVPVACLALVASFRVCAGPRWAGLLIPFPGMTLAMLLVTHLESGPAEASRMARAFPPGNWGMIAFLATFRFGGPGIGMGLATVIGYVLAAVLLLANEMVARRLGSVLPASEPPRIGRRPVTVRRRGLASHTAREVAARGSSSRPVARSRRSGPLRRLSPRLEPIGL